jgi:hypothetical protein
VAEPSAAVQAELQRVAVVQAEPLQAAVVMVQAEPLRAAVVDVRPVAAAVAPAAVAAEVAAVVAEPAVVAAEVAAAAAEPAVVAEEVAAVEVAPAAGSAARYSVVAADHPAGRPVRLVREIPRDVPPAELARSWSEPLSMAPDPEVAEVAAERRQALAAELPAPDAAIPVGALSTVLSVAAAARQVGRPAPRAAGWSQAVRARFYSAAAELPCPRPV